MLFDEAIKQFEKKVQAAKKIPDSSKGIESLIRLKCSEYHVRVRPGHWTRKVNGKYTKAYGLVKAILDVPDWKNFIDLSIRNWVKVSMFLRAFAGYDFPYNTFKLSPFVRHRKAIHRFLKKDMTNYQDYPKATLQYREMYCGTYYDTFKDYSDYIPLVKQPKRTRPSHTRPPSDYGVSIKGSSAFSRCHENY